jgi:hypothetical protein
MMIILMMKGERGLGNLFFFDLSVGLYLLNFAREWN